MKLARSLLARIAVTVAALVVWFWTQSLIGARPLPDTGLGDGLLTLTAPLNEYLHAHRTAANLLLVASSAVIDCLGLLLIGKWLIGASPRPFAGLVIVLLLRQLMQGLVALPEPPNIIWRHPGVPSLFVTYGVANDYFFSGHTAIATLGALELARSRRPWVAPLAVLIVLFEAFTVLVLRAHYTIDVFTGLVTALYVSHVTNRIWLEPKASAPRAES